MDEVEQVNPTDSELPCEDASDQATSGDESNSSESNEISQAIVEEVRALYHYDKVQILMELVKSRIHQTRLSQRVEIMQLALEEASASKMKLQLDLVYSNRIAVLLQDAAKEQVDLSTRMTEKYNTAVDLMSELDLKRVQLLKDTRALQSEFAGAQEQIAQIEKELQEQTSRAESESNRIIEQQKQIDDLLHDNNHLKEQLTQVENQNQTLISSHSAQLNEIEMLLSNQNVQLADAEKRIEKEICTNAALKENFDAVLAEKLQISMELAGLEIRMAEKEKEMESKMQEIEKSFQQQYTIQITESEMKCSKLNEKIVELNSEIKALTDSIEKLRAELADSYNKVNNERNTSEELENKVSGMQAILEDRNNELYSLHAKLNGEQKRFEEQKQQLQQKNSEMQLRLQNIQSESETQKNKLEQLETDLANYVSKLSTMEDQLNARNEELRILKEKQSIIEQTKNAVQHESTAADQTSKMNCNNSIAFQSTLQLTSTPFRPIELSGSSDEIPPKIARNIDTEETPNVQKSIGSSSNYSTFQHRVLQKRATTQYKFFGRKSPSAKNNNQKPLSIGNQRSQSVVLHESLNFSDASTINIDDDPIENTNISNISSSIRLVKPFFRKNQEDP
ncbi:putative leucine-rich repeat-containing protein DDB_G0290503 [Wyeomyia smithii]|uniref:putative leucine-rich repeat-containing protein DDB_G0290503 n=1 Tax=Wyeomyia smithii TaxID=174621 RepID=UPI002467D280|nr:putative leucine-rich repeat-containing protein DDB_G0290503 [Wyeomyia smithii]XP_055528563.1 putative leucine-rich repeat-containing protein DDB_G0290503 [Wyeomyia smithii]XP_055528564.1 putative leucine-rich repeat-containing protein DDB_G0290503 [Wyeomyia smithii]